MDAVLTRIEGSLRAMPPRPLAGERWMRQAAVAVVLCAGDGGAELLLIRRARRRDDPWSGDMAFPGGLMARGDAGPRACAVREAREEIALDLDRHGRFLGELPHVLAAAPRTLPPRPMTITPFVFALSERPRLVPDPREVQEALWAPLARFAEPRHRERFARRVLGVPLRFEGCRCGGRMVWGLTLRMIDALVSVAGPSAEDAAARALR